MSSNTLFRRLTTKAFRNRKTTPVCQPCGPVGRRIEVLEDRTVPSSWNNFNGNAQHTGISTVAAQPTDQILWQTSINLNGTYFYHTGEPVFTPSDTVIVPVKVTSGGNSPGTTNFELEAFNGNTGALLWTATSQYVTPSYSWMPPYQPVYDPVADRVYFPGPGGTLDYISHPDNPGSSTPTPLQVAFYGTANYTANESAYNSTLYINTPLTVDNAGNVFFGFTETGSNPSGINDGGVGRVSATGAGTYVLGGAAIQVSGGTGTPALGSVPALSNDDSIVYIAINGSNGPNLVGLNATTLAPEYAVVLSVPNSGTGVELINVSTAAPMVAPDGTVFMGVFADNYDGSRGLMTHYSANLATEYTPGAFGWDDTASIIPTSMVPSYTGTSPYLILTKYNNYVAAETGSSGGNGVNEIAVLDPYATQTDPNNDPNPSMLVMKQILTITSPTEDSGYINGGYPDATREWCTNGTAVDPATDSVFINNEDGYSYRWNLATDTITQAVEITDGYGEPYTPTAIGPNGVVYAINGGTLFALGGYSNDTLTNVSSLNPAVIGQPVTFTTTLASTDGGAVPTGNITYSYTSGVNNPLNSTPVTLGTKPLVNGQATFTTSALVPDHYHIIATYSGDATDGYAAGSTTLVQVVLANPTTTVTSSAPTITVGQSVTFTATVNPEGVFFVPLGTVSFMDGTTLLGTVALNPLDQSTSPSSSQMATLTTSSLPAGHDSITAVYSGDLNFAGSTSSSITQTVDQAPAFSSAANATFTVGSIGTFTVTATGFPAPTYAVTTGMLPSGLILNPTTGVLSGNPAMGTAGVYNLVLTASNGVSPNATQNFTLTVITGSVPLGEGGSFDFQPVGSATQPGFYAVTPSTTPGSATPVGAANDGWLNPGAGAYDRQATYGASGVPNSPGLATLLQTAEWGNQGGGANDGVFQVTVVPHQIVQVTAYIGDTFGSGRDLINVYVGTPSNPYESLLNPSPNTFNTFASTSYKYVSYSGMFNPGSSSTLLFTIDKPYGGTSAFWTISGLDVRPLGLVAPLTVTRADSAPFSQPQVADGLTVDTYNGSGAAPYAELTINPQNGTPYGTDIDPAVKGFQVQANALGGFTFQILRPTGDEPSLITVTEVTGASGTGQVGPTAAGGLAVSSSPYLLPNPVYQTYTLPVVRRIDVGPLGTPAVSDSGPAYLVFDNSPYISTAVNAMGWIGTAPTTFDSGGSPNNLQRDGVYGTSSTPGDFEVDMPAANAVYSVTVLLGDPLSPESGMYVEVVNPATGTIIESTPVTGVSTQAGLSSSFTFPVTSDSLGRIRLRFGTTTVDWTLQDVEVRPVVGTASPPVGTQADLTLSEGSFSTPYTGTASGTGGSYSGVTLTGTPLVADGQTSTTYTISGATPNSLITVTTSLGTLTTADVGATYTGIQVLANGSGVATFAITAPLSASTLTGTITLTEVTGASLGVFTQNYSGVSTSPPASPPTTLQRYEFTYNGSPVQPESVPFTAVPNTTVYTGTIGYGWQTAVGGYDRGAAMVPAGEPTNLFRAGAWGEGSATFAVSVPKGSTDDVRVYVGDPYNAWSGITVSVEGNPTPAAVDGTIDRYGFVALTGTDSNDDGILDITINGGVWVASGMDIATTGHLPTPATLPTTPVSSTTPTRLEFASSAISGFIAVPNTATYTPSAGYGWGYGVNSFVRPASMFPTGSTVVNKAFYGSGAWGEGATTFEFAVPLNSSATYSVQAYVTDPYNNWGGITLSGEGVGTSPPVTASIGATAPGTVIQLTGLKDVNGDGIITVTVNGPVWVLNGLDIVQGAIGSLPTAPS
jgi:hypothetical protein